MQYLCNASAVGVEILEMKCCGSARQATIALGVQRLPGLLPVREPQAEREALALCGSAQAGRRDFFAKNRRDFFAKAHRVFCKMRP